MPVGTISLDRQPPSDSANAAVMPATASRRTEQRNVGRCDTDGRIRTVQTPDDATDKLRPKTRRTPEKPSNPRRLAQSKYQPGKPIAVGVLWICRDAAEQPVSAAIADCRNLSDHSAGWLGGFTGCFLPLAPRRNRPCAALSIKRP